jgi:hypothetical protein
MWYKFTLSAALAVWELSGKADRYRWQFSSNHFKVGKIRNAPNPG